MNKSINQSINQSTRKYTVCAMQSYKTLVCVVTAFPVVWFLGETIQFTPPWGIVSSSLFWVPGRGSRDVEFDHCGVALYLYLWNCYFWGRRRSQVDRTESGRLLWYWLISGFWLACRDIKPNHQHQLLILLRIRRTAVGVIVSSKNECRSWKRTRRW